MVVGIPGTENIKQNNDTGEFILYTNIRGDYYEIATNKNLLKLVRKRNMILDDGGYEEYLRKKQRLKINHKYYHKHHNKFVIHKFINGKMKVFGSVDSEETAKSIVYLLFYNNWDVDSLPLNFQEELKPRQPKNYIYNKGKYSITHTVNGETTFYGNVDSEEEAKEIINELKKVDWNVDYLPYLCKKKLMSKKPKYYTQNKKSGKYTVQKTVNGKHYAFGSYETEEEAKSIVSLLMGVDWDINKLNDVDRNKLSIFKPNSYKHYFFDNTYKKYVVQKSNGGKNKVYAKLDSEEDAKELVEELKKVNWDGSVLPSEFRDKLVKNNPKYYYKNSTGGYRIVKIINGKEKYFGTFNTVDEAKSRVEYLKSLDWNV